ncbi:ABC transporter substrate-binding protein [Rhodococcus antarcticus]|uniref:ABC transporter substrate-binding protein n=1 Tax=Rhodococcus antarcticus TaxID=2987751 RepID=A0ABY6P4H1_9NOCA|nr:ABC transporter substrate-binding protein [Rhodococcus antarcticus]UZJ25973.1 ABC transporter substrate-binding protein [Rhodococcus antarcticus]
MTLHRRAFLGVTLAAVLAAGCAAPAPTPETVGAQDFSSVLAQAQGQTVSLWMYSGDTQGNAYVDDVLTPAVAAQGVTLRRVPVADTADALARVLSERQAGVTDGSVDLVWVNGANFSTGRQAGAWLCGWAGGLPNVALTDPDDPLLASDFGVPVDGCEAPWHKAQFSLVYDAAKVPDPPTTLAGVLDWARAHPGRFTYPAPPDFTGSVFVRQVLTSVTGGGDAVPRTFDQAAYDQDAPALLSTLRDLAPSLWRGGTTYPRTGEELNQLYADGQVDMTMTYGPATLTDLVAKGTYPATTTVLPLEEGTFGNASFLALPASSGARAGAMVVANTALSPEQQAAKADPTTWGQFPVLDQARLTPAQRAPFEALPSSPVVPTYAELSRNAQAELAPAWVTALDAGWRSQVLGG